MQFLESKPVVEELRLRIKRRAAELIDAGVEPQVAVVLVGEDPQSATYVSIKSARAKELGVILSLYHFPADVSLEEITSTLEYLATDEDIHGIIVQLPLPSRFSSEQVDGLLKLIPEQKDVDGLAGRWRARLGETPGLDMREFLEALAGFIPPIVSGTVSLLEHYGVGLGGKKVVLIGKGRLVGAPLLAYLQAAGIDVQAVDEETEGILDVTKQADVLITGTGQADLITYQWIKEGAVVVDCADDLHRDSVEQLAAAVTPKRGGVGPLTVHWLLYNVTLAAQRQAEGETA